MNKKRLKFVSGIVANASAVLLGVAAAGTVMLYENVGNVNSMLNIKTQEIVQAEDDGVGRDNMYWKSDYSSIKSLQSAIMDKMAEVTAEGAVLLKNEKNALPLTSSAGVSLFSASSVNIIYSGGGSSSCASRDDGATSKGDGETYDLKAALEKENFKINSGLWDFYAANKDKYIVWQTSTTRANAAAFTVHEAPWSALPSAKTEKAEAAIFVISRFGTEGTDVPINKTSDSQLTNGNYLELSPEEKDVLSNLKAQKDAGTFDKIVVLMNTAVPVQCDFVDDEAYGVDALMWIGMPGSSGTLGIAELLSGKKNPSGRLTDTFWTKHLYNPVYANWGATAYPGDGLPYGTRSNSYVVYQEGIYNGYRYTETRYEDTVLGTPKTGDFDYDKIVSYPFGYGLSYTSFEYSGFNVSYNQLLDEYTVNLTVTNTGNVAGKEVVQIYVQKPYTDYDKKNGIEKSAVDLVGFAKTDDLQANGGTEEVSITVDGSELASYDAYAAETWIVDEGDYYFTVAKDAHDAVNNILSAKKENGVSINEAKMTARGNAELTHKVAKTFDAEKYSVSEITGNKITNQFSNADLNLYESTSNNSVEYITRNNWEGTVKFGYSDDGQYTPLNNTVVINTDNIMVADANKKVPVRDDLEYPTYGADNNLTLASLVAAEYDAEGNIVSWKVVDYDNELWDKLLDQLSWEDTVNLLSNSSHKTVTLESIAKPQTLDNNGSLGPNMAYNNNSNQAVNRYAFYLEDPDADMPSPQYPNSSLLAATYNVDLAEELAELKGEQCLWSGYSGIYGPGANMHRGAYGGRAFEYYSEDGFLSGKMLAKECYGIQSKGCYVYMKHAVLNDMENNREGVCTWVNEQTIREIYLKPIGMGITEGGAYGVMTGFNRIGLEWTGSQGFCNSVLRGEFGMRGFNVSDYWQRTYMSVAASVIGGGDLPDGDTGSSELDAYKEGYGGFAQEMREVAHRVLYTVAGSNAMNGFDTNTRVIYYTPWWQPLSSALIVMFAIVFAASAGLWIFFEVKGKLAKSKDYYNVK